MRANSFGNLFCDFLLCFCENKVLIGPVCKYQEWVCTVIRKDKSGPLSKQLTQMRSEKFLSGPKDNVLIRSQENPGCMCTEAKPHNDKTTN